MKNKISTKISNSHFLHKRLVIDGFIIGIVAGSASVFYRFILSKLGDLRFFLFKDLNSPILLVLSLLIAGFIIGKLVKWEPLSSGSGIPQVQAELMGKVYMNSPRLVVSKFIGGGLSNLAGLSLGREGPSIQIGAAVSKMLSKIMKRDNTEER